MAGDQTRKNKSQKILAPRISLLKATTNFSVNGFVNLFQKPAKKMAWSIPLVVCI